MSRAAPLQVRISPEASIASTPAATFCSTAASRLWARPSSRLPRSTSSLLALQLAGHGVEGADQDAQLVVHLDLDPVVEVAVAHPPGAVDQGLDRLGDAPGEAQPDRRKGQDHQQGDHQQVLQVGRADLVAIDRRADVLLIGEHQAVVVLGDVARQHPAGHHHGARQLADLGGRAPPMAAPRRRRPAPAARLCRPGRPPAPRCGLWRSLPRAPAPGRAGRAAARSRGPDRPPRGSGRDRRRPPGSRPRTPRAAGSPLLQGRLLAQVAEVEADQPVEREAGGPLVAAFDLAVEVSRRSALVCSSTSPTGRLNQASKELTISWVAKGRGSAPGSAKGQSR